MINAKYKDRLFTFIFGNAERKEWTLSLYNAVNGSSYTNPDDIMFMTMDIETAVDSALDNMPDGSELKELLIANKAEVRAA